MDKSKAKRLVVGICHSDPVTKDGEYCLTLDELVAFGRSTESEEREGCARMLELTDSQLLLMAGEMTAQELRTVKAVLAQRASAIRKRSNAK